MTADVSLQFIEAIICFAIGCWFAVKYAFTEVIAGCSGRILRAVLQFFYGLSYVVSIGVAVYFMADGELEWYHFLMQALGMVALLPLSRKIFVKFRRPILKIWLRLLGKIDCLNDCDDIKHENKNCANCDKARNKRHVLKNHAKLKTKSDILKR